MTIMKPTGLLAVLAAIAAFAPTAHASEAGGAPRAVPAAGLTAPLGSTKGSALGGARAELAVSGRATTRRALSTLPAIEQDNSAVRRFLPEVEDEVLARGRLASSHTGPHADGLLLDRSARRARR